MMWTKKMNSYYMKPKEYNREEIEKDMPSPQITDDTFH